MLEGVFARVVAAARRLRRFERRELAAFGRWIQHTGNLLHLTVLTAVPLIIGAVTLVSNALAELSFLLFPPLASGTYTLFVDPEGRYASPWKFTVGLVVGACCGWAALALSARVLPGTAVVSPLGAALSIFLTGATTWLLDVEEPAAHPSRRPSARRRTPTATWWSRPTRSTGASSRRTSRGCSRAGTTPWPSVRRRAVAAGGACS